MTGKHRKRNERVAKFTALGAATATATALTVGIPPEPRIDAEHAPRVIDAKVDLVAAVNTWPGPGQIPDISGGLGSAAYNAGQAAAEALLRAIVENFNLAALAQAAGADPQAVLDTLLGGLLGKLPANLLDDILGNIPIDVSGLVSALIAPLGPLGNLLQPVVDLLTQNLLPNTLGGLLGVLGIDLSDVLNLSDLNVPGVNIVTAGPAFSLLKLLGVDLGWVPGLPNAVANEINNSDYLPVEVNLRQLLTGLVGAPTVGLLEGLLGVDIPDINAVNIRVTTVVGFGLGAFAAGMSLDQVFDNLPQQPGGGGLGAQQSVLGSFTVLPMILLRNPGRANGGLLARLYPLFGLLGIDTVTPETQVMSRGGIPLLNTGLSLGGANLIPVKVDGTVEYDPLSDFAAWPNPFSLANNVAAGLLPTYILRGLSLDTVTQQLEEQLANLIPDDYDGSLALKLNLYLTLKSATLPMLEPLYLASDALNAVTFGAFPVNPFNMIANALAPALTSLVNLGYTDVVFNPQTGAYERTLTEADDPTPFLSFPKVDWSQVPGVVFNQLVKGIQKEFFSGNPTPGTPNVLTNLFDFLGGDLLGGLQLGGLNEIVDKLLRNVLGNLGVQLPAAAQKPAALMAAADVPKANARMVTLSTEATALDQSADGAKESGAGASTEEKPSGDVTADGQVGQQPPAQEAAEQTPAKEAAAEVKPAIEEQKTDEKPADEQGQSDEGDEGKAADEKSGDKASDDTADDKAGDKSGDKASGDKASDDKKSDDKKSDDKKSEPKGPRHAKPDNGQPRKPGSLHTPRHAKPDRGASDTNGGNGSDAGGSSNNGSGDSSGAAGKAA
jgi:hypothetical protein